MVFPTTVFAANDFTAFYVCFIGNSITGKKRVNHQGFIGFNQF
jgi:hypothetical protein